MDKRISKASRIELIEALRKRYQRSTKREKSIILDEFVSLTGFHRKHAIRLLTGNKPVIGKSISYGRKIYGEAVKEALIILWEASDRICGKRLKAIMPQMIDSMERCGHIALDPDLREHLLLISASTIDRMLSPVREQAKGRKKKRNSQNKVSKEIPVKTYSDWKEPVPGEVEIDFVVHCGSKSQGGCIHSLVATDVCTGWTEVVPMLAREQTLATEALDVIRNRFPVPIISITSDNDGAFINDTLLEYCKDKNLKFTRSRPYQKNDQAWIEQKNGAVVRRFVGYDRFSGIVAGRLFGRLYYSLRLYVNYFQPSFKLIEKTRDGSRVKKRYSSPMTPAARFLEHALVSEEEKETLRKQLNRIDPLKLLHHIRDTQAALASIISPGRTERPCADLEEFLAQLSRLWESGEVRPTHRKPQEVPRDWRTRPDPFEDTWPQILYWLTEDPDIMAKSILERLMLKYPEKYSRGQLRTLQRRVTQWRAVVARELIFAGDDTDEEMAESFL